MVLVFTGLGQDRLLRMNDPGLKKLLRDSPQVSEVTFQSFIRMFDFTLCT